MFAKPLLWLRQKWWGLVVAYVMLVASIYLVLWQFAEPLGIPESIGFLPSFVKSRAFIHATLTLLLAAYATLMLELVVRRNLTGDPASATGIRPCGSPNQCIVRVIRSTEELASMIKLRSNENERNCYEALAKSECLLEGHFKLVSGKHSSRFIVFRRILDNPTARDFFVRQVVELVSGIQFSRIIGPSSTSGGSFADDISKILKVKTALFPVEYAKRRLDISDARARGLFGERCLYVDDLITSGDGIITAVEQLRSKNINVVGVAVAFARDMAAIDIASKRLGAQGIDLLVYANVDLSEFTWDEQDCKLCQLLFGQDLN